MAHNYGLDGDQQKAIKTAIDRLFWSTQTMEVKLQIVNRQLSGDQELLAKHENGKFKKRFEAEKERLEKVIQENRVAVRILKDLV